MSPLLKARTCPRTPNKNPKLGTRPSHNWTEHAFSVIRSMTLNPCLTGYCDVLFLVGTNIAVIAANKLEGNMKPIPKIADRSNRFPLIDCDYRPMTLDGYRARRVRTRAPHFQNISGEYFQNEARYDFLLEAVCFVLIIVTAVAPLVSAANAVVDLCRAFAHL